MSSRIYIAIVVVITVSAACNNTIKADPEFSYDKMTKKADTINANSQLTAPLTNTPATTVPALPATNSTTVLNPEHGKPGHRCDIAVGAPLNSKPSSTNTAPVEQTQPVTVNTPKTVTAQGMNPPHGEPGHRCDIAVGAPLNSKPVTTPAKQNQPIGLTAKKTVTPPGMNPPHGEPGHRCDIAVGSPLKQPVKNTTADTTVKTVSQAGKDSAKN